MLVWALDSRKLVDGMARRLIDPIDAFRKAREDLWHPQLHHNIAEYSVPHLILRKLKSANFDTSEVTFHIP